MSRQTDKEEREAAEREAEAKAKARAKAKEEDEREEAKARARDEEAKAKAKGVPFEKVEPAAKKDQIVNLSTEVDSAQKPYPHGSPPDPEDEFEKIHGFRRVKP
jgi:hypothetical protein